MFTLAGALGVVAAIVAVNSRQYRQLSAAYANAPSAPQSVQ